MSTHTLGENLNKLIKLRGGVSLTEISRHTKIPQPTLHHIIDGKTKKPRMGAIKALAAYFTVTVQQLTGESPLVINSEDIEAKKISAVPLIDWQTAKTWQKDSSHPAAEEHVLLQRDVDRSAFAITLTDSTLEPLFQENSILIFNPNKAPKDRDFALVYFAEQDRLVVNRLLIEGNVYFLRVEKSDGNAELIKIKMPQDRIIGLLIESRVKF